MEFRHLHYFIAVAEELHFGRAAEKLGMAQPPLSQQIRKLEEELGVLLFQRTKRHVQLTDAGRSFLKEAQRLVEQAQRAVSAAQSAARGKRGVLTIGFIGTVTYDLFPRVLRAFRERFAEVEIVLRELTSSEQIEAVRDQRISLGFVRAPLDAEGLSTETIHREPLVVALPEHHPLAAQPTLQLKQLAQVPLCVCPRHSAGRYYDIIIEACRQAGFTPTVAQEAVQLHTMIGLVSAGLGVALVPSSVQSFQRTGVVYRPVTGPTPWVELSLIWRRDETSALVQEFLEVTREVARSAHRDGLAKLPGGRRRPGED